MKKTLLIVLAILIVSLVSFAQGGPKNKSGTPLTSDLLATELNVAQTPPTRSAAPIALTADEQKEILDIQTQIDKLKLLQENAILRAANEHGVSLRRYELGQSGGQLVFTERAQTTGQVTKP